MCGIAGLAGPRGADLAALPRMIGTLAHRGPDDRGMETWPEAGVGLAHSRLSIIDLSPLGRNPMPNEDGSVWVVFNGEIYNHAELRRELEQHGHRFRSRADTEVLVHAYEQWGDDHVHHLRGMFAYALYDRRSGRQRSGSRLLLVRDRLGIKPLFYADSSRGLVFGSEIKAVLASGWADEQVDRSALFDFLTYLYIPAPKTAYRDVRALPPGYLAVWEEGRVHVQQYWDVDVNRSPAASTPEAAIELVRTRVQDAVQTHMVSEVPLGVFLSGGVDSASVVACASNASSDPVTTFSVGFDVESHSETAYAQLVADRYHTRHTVEEVSVASAQRGASDILRLHDQPFADTSAVPTGELSRVARQRVTVALSGDGGDEVFGGYGWYAAWLGRQMIDAVPLAARRPIFRQVREHWPASWYGRSLLRDLASSPLERYARLVELFSPAEKRRLLPPDWTTEFAGYDDYWHLRKFWREDLDPVTRVQYVDLKTFLPDDILAKVDRASMAVSLEVRPPLLDHLLVEEVFALPAAIRLYKGPKSLLKQAMEPLLPQEVLARPKKGFSAPMTTWVQQSRPWMSARLAHGQRQGFLARGLGQASWLYERGAKAWAAVLLTEWLDARYQRTARAQSAVS
jgi:asparagine synthase (glutamine-hydrolysing)